METTLSTQNQLSLKSSGEISTFPEKWVMRLFEEFSLLYGALWTSKTDDECLNKMIVAWKRHLSGLEAADVRRGLSRLRERDNAQFPPSVFEFYKLCTDYELMIMPVTQIEEIVESDEEKEKRMAIGREHIKKCLDILKGKL